MDPRDPAAIRLETYIDNPKEGTTMTLKGFAEEHGISAIARRHFGYAKPVSDNELGGYAARGALTYMRALDMRLLGLTHQEACKAFEQGQQLVALGVTPALILTGIDQRNLDGGKATAEGIVNAGGSEPRVYTSPAVTYPHYTDFATVRDALAEFEDVAVHRNLAGRLNLWSETAKVFDMRIRKAVEADYGVSPVLFDLNYEQITLLYFRLVQRVSKLKDIPCEGEVWQPTMGGGVVLSADRNVAKEFKPDLTIVE